MKKILYSVIAIVIMGLSVGTYYFYDQNAKSQIEIKDLEKEIKKLNKDIKKSKETISTQNSIIKTYEAVLDEEILIENENTDSGYSNIKLISVNKLIDLMSEDQDFILLISQTYCSHCIAFKPIYNEVLKENNLTGYEIDLLTLTEKQEEYVTDIHVSGLHLLGMINEILELSKIEAKTSPSEINCISFILKKLS